MEAFLGFLGDSPLAKMVPEEAKISNADEHADSVASQFQDFVWDLEKVGLRNWLRMDIRDLERFLPKVARGNKDDPLNDPVRVDSADDCEVAWLMLRCAARGRANLLDFEKIDPYKLLHGLPARTVDEELEELPSNKFLDDQ